MERVQYVFRIGSYTVWLIKLISLSEANRDIMDWSGNKPLDYSRQRPSVSASTCSSEYLKYFPTEQNNNYHLGGAYFDNPVLIKGDIGGGGTLGSALTRRKKRSQMMYATVSGASVPRGGTVSRTQSLMASTRRYKKPLVQSMIFKDNIDEDKSVEADKPKKDTNNPIIPIPNEEQQTAPENVAKPRSAPTRRKESFLRKTFRSTAGASRPSKEAVTNPKNPQT